MRRDEFTEMRAFLEVAREREFNTRAAAKLGRHPLGAQPYQSGRSRSGSASASSPARPVTSHRPRHGRAPRAEHRAPFRGHQPPRSRALQRPAATSPPATSASCAPTMPSRLGLPPPAASRSCASHPDIQRGTHRRQRLHEYRRTPVRRRRTARRRRSRGTWSPFALVPMFSYAVAGSPDDFERCSGAGKPAGPHRPQLRQPAASNVGRASTLGSSTRDAREFSVRVDGQLTLHVPSRPALDAVPRRRRS